MQQPSAQGIASLYRGNPQPLQQVIQKEQQAKPGIPPDLQKLLALQIVNNEKDSFTAQKAMQQLQQMSGPQGKPPTVMQTLQQQAEQKMQAQAQMARQQAAQRGLPASILGVQGDPAQPDRQPEVEAASQGIDQLPVDFGMAEGGIVAFSGEKRSDVPEAEEGSGIGKYADAPRLAAELGVPVLVYRRAADLAARMGTTVGEVLKTMGKDVVRNTASGLKGTASNAVKAGATPAAGVVLAGGIPATQFAGDVVRAASPEQRAGFYDSPMMGAMGGDAGIAAAIMNASAEGQKQREKTQAAVAADNRAMLNKADAKVFAAPGIPAKPVTDLKALADQKQKTPAVFTPTKPAPAPAPVAEIPPAEASESEAMGIVKTRMNEDPELMRMAEVARYQREVGDPDTSVHDRLIAELENRKKQFEGPQDSWGRLSEYLGQIAAGGRGRKWYEAGAQGAAEVDKLKKSRQAQQFELSKQALDVSQKKLDTVRAFAKEAYNVGKTTFDQVYKGQLDAARDVVKDEAEARKLAQENTLRRLEMENQRQLEEMRGKNQIAAASVRAAGTGGGDKQTLAELKALQTSLKDQLKTAFTKTERQQVQSELSAVNAAIAKMAGLDTMGAAPGAVGPGGIPSDVQALLKKYGGK